MSKKLITNSKKQTNIEGKLGMAQILFHKSKYARKLKMNKFI